MKKFLQIILIFILIVFIGVSLSILTRSKGEWVCEEGQWIKLGSPKEPMPGWGCGQREEKQEEATDSQKPAGIPLGSFQIPGSQGWNLFPEEYKEATHSFK